MISREELDRHNEEGGGGWVVVHGRVYDTVTLAKMAPCDAERLAEWVGQDASKAFDVVCHSQSAKEQLHQFCLGIFKGVSRILHTRFYGVSVMAMYLHFA